MYLRRGSQIALYISTNKQFARLNAGEPEAEAIQEALARIQLALFSRFADLAGTDYVVSSIKDADLKLGGVKRSCHQIRLKSPATDKPGWNAEIWIEKGSKFVRRASLLKNEDGGLLEEVLDFIELRSGKDAAAALTDLDWEPPAGAVPFERVPKGPLPQ